MFSNGADVNLNKVYRSSSAASTEFTIGEIYRQTGSNAVFKFVEIGAGTAATQPTVVQGTILAQEAGAARAWDGVLTAGYKGTNFAGVAQNTEAVTSADTVAGVTVCIWSQVAGKSISHVAALQDETADSADNEIAEMVLNVATAGANTNGLFMDAAATTAVKVANVMSISDSQILATFDGATALDADFQNLEVGSAIIPHGVATGGNSTVNAVYKDRAGNCRGLLFTVDGGDYLKIENYAKVKANGTDFGHACSVSTAGNTMLLGAY